MMFAILLFLPVVLVGMMWGIYRSRWPNWLKVILIGALGFMLARVLIAIAGVF